MFQVLCVTRGLYKVDRRISKVKLSSRQAAHSRLPLALRALPWNFQQPLAIFAINTSHLRRPRDKDTAHSPHPTQRQRQRQRQTALQSSDMLGTSITRVARSACTPCSTRTHITADCYPLSICSMSGYQHRHSSSKASIPPNGAFRGRATATPSQQAPTSSNGRVSRRKTKVAVIESRFARLPSVPSTEHLNEAGMLIIFGRILLCLNRRISTNPPLTPRYQRLLFLLPGIPSNIRYNRLSSSVDTSVLCKHI
jgi:hypothetical protein